MRLAALLVLLVSMGSAMAGEAPPPCADAFARIVRGEPALLVVLPPSANEKAHPEAYSDWVHYLTEYLETAPSLCVHSLPPSAWRAHVATPRLRSSFATVFVRRGVALVYDGMAFGPQTYAAGRRFLADGSAADAEATGMKARPFRLREAAPPR